MLKREKKALVACRKGHDRALGQNESQLLLPARHLSFQGGNLSYFVTWVPSPAVHLFYQPPLWNHQDDHWYSLEQDKADSGFSVQGRLKPPLQARLSLKQRGACKNSPCLSLHPPKSTSTLLCCGTSAKLEQTRFWHLQQSLEMPNEEQMAGLGEGAVTKAKWWTANFWDTWKQAKMPPHP